MAISVSNSIEINATPQLVWEVFTDIYNWGEWNPLIIGAHQIYRRKLMGSWGDVRSEV